VRRMRLEQVDPQKKFLGAGCWCYAEPGDGFVDDLRSRALVHEAAVGSARHPVAVDVEAAVQPELMIERKRGDERGRPEPGGVKRRRERRHGIGHAKAVVARAVSGWVAAREQRRVRGERDRCGGVRALEERATARE